MQLLVNGRGLVDKCNFERWDVLLIEQLLVNGCGLAGGCNIERWDVLLVSAIVSQWEWFR